MVNNEAKADDIIPNRTPVLYLVSKWNIRNIPATAIRLKAISFTETRFLFMKGSKIAVKKLISDRHTTPIETFENLILA